MTDPRPTDASELRVDGAPAPPWFWIVVGVLVAAKILSLAVAMSGDQSASDSILGGDARRYHEIAFAQGTPYADFAVEYPPVPLGLVRILDSEDPSVLLARLVVSQLALDLATAGVLWWGFGRRTLLAYLVLGAPFLLYPFPYFRIDLVAVFLAAAGMALLARHRDLPAGIVAAVAVFAKAWPIVLGGAFLVERRSRAGLAWIVTGLIGVVAWVVWAGTNGAVEVFSLRGATGWQLESLPGIALHTGEPLRAHVESGAWRTAIMPAWTRPALTALSIGGVVAAWVLAERRRRAGCSSAVSYGLAPVAAICSMLVFAPIISPQYLLWLLPWGAVLAARGDRLLSVLLLGANLASTFGLLRIEDQLAGSAVGTAPIIVRNVLLVALLAAALAQLAGALRAPALRPAS